MKYVLMYTNRPDLDAAVPEERRMEVYRPIFQWFETHASVFVDAGAELQGPETATTVRSGENGSPRRRRRSVLGGQGGDRRVQRHRRRDLDAALELARSWPSLGFPGIAVEVRPIVEHRMD